LKNTKVTLPEGLVINPGQAAGLVACRAAEANVHGEGPAVVSGGVEGGDGQDPDTVVGRRARKANWKATLYVLQSNPPNLQLLVAASADGIFLKLVGDVHLNETTATDDDVHGNAGVAVHGLPNCPSRVVRRRRWRPQRVAVLRHELGLHAVDEPGR